LAEAARLTSDDPTVLDDRRNFTRPLQHGNVGKRVAVPNHDVGELAGGNHADLTFEAYEPGIAARIGDDRFHRRHTDLLDQQLRLFAVPTPMAEGRGVAGVAAAHHQYAAIARIAKHLEGGVQLRAQAIPHPITQTSAGTAVLDPDPGRGQHWRERHPGLGDDVEIVLRCQIRVVDQIPALAAARVEVEPREWMVTLTLCR
jgi:hypothetical protein